MARAVMKRLGGRRYARAAIQVFEEGARIAVLARQKNRLVVADLIRVAFPELGGGEEGSVSGRSAAIRDAMRSRGWTPGKMTLVLPKNIVTLRLVTLPSDDDNELKEMAHFEAQKHIPFNVDRHVIDYAVLRKEGVEGSQTLIVAVDRAALEEPLAICREAGIELQEARVSSLALVEALLLDPPQAFDEATIGLIDIGWSTVDITIVSEGIVRFTRSGAMGIQRVAPVLEEMLGGDTTLTSENLRSLDALEPGSFSDRRPLQPRQTEKRSFVVDDFAEDEPVEPTSDKPTPPIRIDDGQELGAGDSRPTGPAADVVNWFGRIVQEIERTYTFAAREFECPHLEAVFLAGAGSYIHNLDAFLGKRLDCPVELIQPPGTVDFASRDSADLKADWGEFAVPIGAAAGEALPPINLLPSEYTEQQAARRRRRSMVVTGLLGALLLSVGAAYATIWFQDIQQQIEFYQKNNESLEPQFQELRDMEKQFEKLKEILNDPLSASVVLEKISAIDLIVDEPPKVTLQEYLYSKGGGVTLTGFALTYTDLVAFIEALKKTKCFHDVVQKDRSQFKLPRGRPEVIRFTLICDFSPDESE